MTENNVPATSSTGKWGQPTQSADAGQRWVDREPRLCDLPEAEKAQITAHRKWIVGRVTVMLRHYAGRDQAPEVTAAIMADWLRLLWYYDQQDIEAACDEYMMDGKPFKPTPGEIYQLTLKAMTARYRHKKEVEARRKAREAAESAPPSPPQPTPEEEEARAAALAEKRRRADEIVAGFNRTLVRGKPSNDV